MAKGGKSEVKKETKAVRTPKGGKAPPSGATDAQQLVQDLLSGKAEVKNDFQKYLLDGLKKTGEDLQQIEQSIQQAQNQLKQLTERRLTMIGEYGKAVKDLAEWDRELN